MIKTENNSLNNRALWFSRKFYFEIANGNFYSILERLKDAPFRLEKKLEGLSDEVLTSRYQNAWSIQENAGHLVDLESLWIGRVADIGTGQEYARSADLENTKTHEAKHNAAHLAQLLKEFWNQRAHFVRLCKEHVAIAETQHSLHPRLKTPMRIIDLMFFAAEHDDHHLASITELIEHFEKAA